MPSFTITVTTQEQDKIAPAMGEYLRLGRPATGPEVKHGVIEWMKSITTQYWWKADSGQYKLNYVPRDIDPQ